MNKNTSFLRKKKSKIHGFGIFTTRKIKKGEVFYKVPLRTIYKEPKSRCAYIGNGRFVSDERVLNWVNHSCEPNTILDIKKKIPTLKAKRDITVGEEITCNYNLTEINGVKIQCKCGNKKCKGFFLRRE